MVTVVQEMEARRRAHWGQTAETRTPDPIAATGLIERTGIATLYPVSDEFPNLLYAYTGTNTTKVTSEWDSVSGDVYSWRWVLGRQEAAFYCVLMRNRPTLVAWHLLSAVLRLRAELRPVVEIYEAGQLSVGAYRIAVALEEAGGVLETGALRRAAGFPVGKEQRAAFLKAIAELDSRLLLAKVFAQDDQDMRHALVTERYPTAVAAAVRLTYEQAMDQVLAIYLPQAVYALPELLARHLGLSAAEVRAGLERLVAAGQATVEHPEGKAPLRYLWVTP